MEVPLFDYWPVQGRSPEPKLYIRMIPAREGRNYFFQYFDAISIMLAIIDIMPMFLVWHGRSLSRTDRNGRITLAFGTIPGEGSPR
jgi:hypothetical protein